MPEIEIPDPHETKEKAENPFTKKIALCVAIYAVVLAIAAAGGGNASKSMLMEQMNAIDEWNQFQAKSIRESNYLNDLESSEIALLDNNFSSEQKEKLLKKIARVKAKLEDYKKDKAEIMAKAKHHEAVRDNAHHRDPYFEFAEVMMQIAIVLASVAMLSGRHWAFIASMVLAVIGIALTVNGYTLLDHGKLLG